MDTVRISRKEYECLRGHLEAAAKIFNSLGLSDGSLTKESKTPVRTTKETKVQKINKYKDLISSGQRGTKPSHLKK